MKPTQEQIEAALQNTRKLLAWEMIDEEDSVVVLAAAYREAMAEIERLKPWADLAISSNALMEIERAKNKQH